MRDICIFNTVLSAENAISRTGKKFFRTSVREIAFSTGKTITYKTPIEGIHCNMANSNVSKNTFCQLILSVLQHLKILLVRKVSPGSLRIHNNVSLGNGPPEASSY